MRMVMMRMMMVMMMTMMMMVMMMTTIMMVMTTVMTPSWLRTDRGQHRELMEFSHPRDTRLGGTTRSHRTLVPGQAVMDEEAARREAKSDIFTDPDFFPDLTRKKEALAEVPLWLVLLR
jgi:hypothetical protein